jgi:hypothetical protein
METLYADVNQQQKPENAEVLRRRPKSAVIVEADSDCRLWSA